jgi:hypothetical protein
MTGAEGELDRPTRLVEVFATPSAPEAEVVRSLLESDDIPVVVKGMTQGPYRMGATYLLVPEELEEHARLVIEAARSDAASGTPAWSDGDSNG